MERAYHPKYQQLRQVNELKRAYVGRNSPRGLQQREHALRVASYNVHFWADPFDNESRSHDSPDSVDEILEVIRKADADVLFLQEFIATKVVYNGQVIRGDKAVAGLRAMGYVKQVMCNVVPSWFGDPIGNAIFVHLRVLSPEYCVNGFKTCAGLQENI